MQSAVALTTDPEFEPALPLRAHTIFGVCEAIGEDFGFNPVLLRVPLAASVLWSPVLAIGAYLGLGLVVLASRLLFPDRRNAAAEASAKPVSARSNDQANDSANVEKVTLAA
jgi:phage shock protein PspC (stress-responsive transcriptional regulator)